MGIYRQEDLAEFLGENSSKSFKGDFLAIVCNTKKDSQCIATYQGFQVSTEYLSDYEHEQLMEMALNIGIPFRPFYSEADFISFISGADQETLRKLIVYNSAQSGVGPGRKSLIPALCKYYNVRITGSDSYRVSLCRDKFAIISILSRLKLPVPYSELYRKGIQLKLPNKKFIAKPLYESASIGIKKENVFYGDKIPYTYLDNLSEDMNQPLLIQEFINGYEAEIPIFVSADKILCFDPVCLYKGDSVKMGEDFLDYGDIYSDSYRFGDLPISINNTSILRTASEAVRILGLNGLCRIDMRIINGSEYYITDVSTNPHFIEHSSVHYALNRKGENNPLEIMLKII